MVDQIIKLVRAGFTQVEDKRSSNLSYTLPNLLSLAFAMFHLKDPSLSAFKDQFSVRADNLLRVYGVDALPGDTALRESIDEVNPSELQALFRPQMEYLSDQGVLKERHVLGRYTAVSVDGTGHYCSGKKSCPQCLVKNHRGGKVTYYHQLLGAVAVHIRQDGQTKNDCELNASKRIIPQIRSALGVTESILAIFDGLYINGPHIKALTAESISYIIGTKGGTYVDIQAEQLRLKGQLQRLEWLENGKRCVAQFANDLILNGQHQDILTNYFEYAEFDLKTDERVFYSTWVTDFLAFLTDQIAQHLDQDFQAAKAICKTFRLLWEKIRSVFDLLPTMSMNAIYRFIIKRRQVKMPALE